MTVCRREWSLQNVWSYPKSRHPQTTHRCRLMTQSGHEDGDPASASPSPSFSSSVDQSIVSIDAEVFQEAYDFTGGGRFGPKKNVHTKEDADHSLPYLLAVGLLDGDVQPAQLEPSRIAKSDVQDLLQKVTIRPNADFTAHYPAELMSRVTVRLKNGDSYTHDVSAFPGASNRPFTWAEVGAKFDKLSSSNSTAKSRQAIKNAVRSLEDIQVSELTRVLSELNS